MLLFSIQKQSPSRAMAGKGLGSRFIQLQCTLEQCCLPWCSSGTVGSTPAGVGQPCISIVSLGDVSRGSPAHGMSMDCVALVPGWVTQWSPPKHSHDQHKHCTQSPGQGQSGPQGIVAHTGGAAFSAPWHPNRIFHQAGSCGLRMKPVAMGATNPWHRCPGKLFTETLKRNPKNSLKCCSERSGRKLQAQSLWLCGQRWVSTGASGRGYLLCASQTELGWKTLLSGRGSSLPGSELPACSWANGKECTPQQ